MYITSLDAVADTTAEPSSLHYRVKIIAIALSIDSKSCHSMLINKYVYYQAGTPDTLIIVIQFLLAAILCS